MWPFTRKQNELVTISLTPHHLTCCLIEQSQKKDTLHLVKAYTRFPLHHLEFAQAVLFNPTVIKQQITQFLTNAGLSYPRVALSISGPRVFEQIVQTHEASATKTSFALPELETLTCDCSYLCPSQKGGFDFFVCGIKQEHLFSYQLLAHATNIDLVTITTGQHALLQLYKHTRGTSFRQSQLSLDLLANKYDPNALYDATTITQSISIHPSLHIDVAKDYHVLGTHVGLFLSEGSR